MIRAKLLFHNKEQYEDEIVEVKFWSVPKTSDKPHGLKYSLVYIRRGKRIVGYDNAEQKGDHRHIKEKEYRYEFKGMKKLMNDFYKDILANKEKEGGLML